MQRIVAALACALACTAAFADAASKDAKVHKLAELEGLTAMFTEQFGQAQQQAQRASDQMLQQAFNNYDFPPELRQRVEAAAHRFTDSFGMQWSAQELVDNYVRSYSAKVSEEDVDAAIAYLETPSGRRNFEASREAARELGSIMQRRMYAQMQNGAATFFEEVRNAARECNCARRQPVQGPGSVQPQQAQPPGQQPPMGSPPPPQYGNPPPKPRTP
ncbi:MAG TPA: DUF2059 domain-containing protein [Usitatibacter sp.]|nr:DUF2059 domain-containing protein [Usitatibacter sp.]